MAEKLIRFQTTASDFPDILVNMAYVMRAAPTKDGEHTVIVLQTGGETETWKLRLPYETFALIFARLPTED